MATITTSQAKSKIAPSVQGGIVQAAIGYYDVATHGAAQIGDVVQMVWVPKGAIILDVMLQWTALTTTTATVGIGTNTDLFFAAITMTNAGIIGLNGGLSNGAEIDIAVHAGSVGYEFTADDTIDLGIAAAAAGVGDTIKMIVSYVMAGSFETEP